MPDDNIEKPKNKVEESSDSSSQILAADSESGPSDRDTDSTDSSVQSEQNNGESTIDSESIGLRLSNDLDESEGGNGTELESTSLSNRNGNEIQDKTDRGEDASPESLSDIAIGKLKEIFEQAKQVTESSKELVQSADRVMQSLGIQKSTGEDSRHGLASSPSDKEPTREEFRGFELDLAPGKKASFRFYGNGVVQTSYDGNTFNFSPMSANGEQQVSQVNENGSYTPRDVADVNRPIISTTDYETPNSQFSKFELMANGERRFQLKDQGDGATELIQYPANNPQGLKWTRHFGENGGTISAYQDGRKVRDFGPDNSIEGIESVEYNPDGSIGSVVKLQESGDSIESNTDSFDLNGENRSESLDTILTDLRDGERSETLGSEKQTQLITALGRVVLDEAANPRAIEKAVEAIGLLGGKESLRVLGLAIEESGDNRNDFNAKLSDGTQFKFKEDSSGKINLQLITDRPDGGFLRNYWSEQGEFERAVEVTGSGREQKHIDWNSDGNLKELERDDRSKLKIDYEDGEPSRVVDGIGKLFTKQEDGTWTRRNGETVEGKLRINDDYSYSFVSDNSELTINHDGSESYRNIETGLLRQKSTDGTIIESNKDGNVTRTIDRKGNETTYQYEEGELKSYKQGDLEWSKQEDGIWRSSDGETFRGERSVNQDGDLLERREGDLHTKAYQLDGSSLVRDEQDRITEVVNSKGIKTSFDYLENQDQPFKVTYNSGVAWLANNRDKTSWSKLDSEGNRTNDTWNGRTEVDENGTIIETYSKSGNRHEKFTDGSKVVRNPEGNISELNTANQEKFKFGYHSDGRLTRVTKPDGSYVYASSQRGWFDSERNAIGGAGLDQESGTLHISDADFNRTEYSLDGTTSFLDYDSGHVIETTNSQEHSLFELSENGDVQSGSTSIERDNGVTVEFETNSDGQVSRIKESSGKEWTSEDGKTFKLTGTDIEVTGELIVNKDGSYRFNNQEKGDLQVNADGSMSFFNEQDQMFLKVHENGSKVAFDEQGRTTDTTDALGKNRSFAYRGDETVPSRVQEPDGSVWTTDDGNTWKNDQTGDTRKGEIFLSSDGSYNVRNGRGEVSTNKLDGSSLKTSSDGNIEWVRNSQGQEYFFSDFDNRGNPRFVRNPEGVAWRSEDGQKWLSSNGQSRKGSVEVSNDGTITENFEGQPTLTRSTDGWIESKGETTELYRNTKDGSRVFKNEQGQYTHVDYPDKSKRSFGYDADGNLNSITHPDGSKWTTTDGKTWTKDGSEETKEYTTGINQNGIYSERYADDSTRLHLPNSSSVLLDANRNITEATDVNGNIQKFSYQENKLVRIEESDGTVFEKVGVRKWENKSSGEVFSGVKELNSNGTYVSEDSTNNTRTERSLNGISNTYENGKLTRTISAEGNIKDFKYDAEGNVEETVFTNSDGNILAFNSDQQLIRSVDGRGQEKHYRYDKDGKLDQVSFLDKVWTRQSDGSWSTNKGGKYTNVWLSANGDFNYARDGKVKTRHLDGNLRVTDTDQSSILYEKDTDRIIQTIDAEGKTREFSYNSRGDMIQVKMANGETWTRGSYNRSNRAYTWSSDRGSKDRHYRKHEMLEDGTLFAETSARNRIYYHTDGTREVVDYDEMVAAAIEIRKASNVWNLSKGATDEARFWGALEGKSKFQRQYMQEIYPRLRENGKELGITIEEQARIEMEGTDLDRALSLLHTDGRHVDKIGTIRIALTESGYMFGRSSKELEREIRQTVASMSKSEIAKARRDYRARYDGDNFDNAIINNRNLSHRTREAVRIMLKGKENLVKEDYEKLGELAVDGSDATMFQEVMTNAPQSVRDYYTTEAGKEKLDDAFGVKWYETVGAIALLPIVPAAGAYMLMDQSHRRTELRHVHDFAENEGKLSLATVAYDNSSWIVSDNEEAIEQKIDSLSDQERQRYRIGRYLAGDRTGYLSKQDLAVLNGSPQSDGAESTAPMSREERDKAEQYYEKTREALHYVAGTWFSGDGKLNEFSKWEDMIMTPGGSLISKLADHKGFAGWDSSMNDVISDIENMSEADWNRLKESWDASEKNSPYLERLETVLGTYLNQSELRRVMDIVRDKASASDYDASKQVRRPLLEAISDNVTVSSDEYGDTYNGDAPEIYRVIENMTEQEQKDYYENGGDNDFARTVQSRIKRSLTASEQKVSLGMLNNLLEVPPKSPTMDLIDKLNLQASYWDGDEWQIVQDIEKAFAENDGELWQRVKNPQTAADREYRDQFITAAKNAIGSWDFETYVEPIIRDGELKDSEKRLRLSNGYFDDNEQRSYQDAASLPESERNRLLRNPKEFDRVFRHLNDQEKDIARNAVRQGEMAPEDLLRSHVIGAGTSEQEIKDVLADITNRDKDEYEGLTDVQINNRIRNGLSRMRNNYFNKYGEQLSVRLMEELGVRDWNQTERNLYQRSSEEEFLFSMHQATETRSGFGSWLADTVWDGTGFLVDENLNQLARANNMDPSSVHGFADRLYKSVDMHSASKESLANAVVDATLAAAAIGGAAFTGGVSLSLLSYTGLLYTGAAFAGGAAFKVGAKSAIMGGDYDWGLAGIDGLSGGFEAATVFLGANLFKVGGKAAAQAAEESLEVAIKQGLIQGSDDIAKNFTDDLTKLVVNGLNDASKGVSDDAIRELVKKYAVEGSEEALTAIVKSNLAEAVETVGKQWLANTARQFANNTIDGIVGGGGAGAIMASGTANNMQEFVAQAGMSAGFGAGGAFAMTGGITSVGWAGGKAWRGAQRILGRTSDDIGEQAGRVAPDTVSTVDASEGRVTDADAPSTRTSESTGTTDGDQPAVNVDDTVQVESSTSSASEGDPPVVGNQRTRTRPGRRENNSHRIEDLRNRYASGDPNEPYSLYNQTRIEASNTEIKNKVPEAHQQHMLDLVARGPNGKRVADEILQLGPEKSAEFGIYDLLATRPHLDEIDSLVAKAKLSPDVPAARVSTIDHTTTNTHIDRKIELLKQNQKIDSKVGASAQESMEVLRKTLDEMDVEPDTAKNIADLIETAAKEGTVVSPETIKRLAPLTADQSGNLWDLTAKQQKLFVEAMNDSANDPGLLLKKLSNPAELGETLNLISSSKGARSYAQALRFSELPADLQKGLKEVFDSGKVSEKGMDTILDRLAGKPSGDTALDAKITPEILRSLAQSSDKGAKIQLRTVAELISQHSDGTLSRPASVIGRVLDFDPQLSYEMARLIENPNVSSEQLDSIIDDVAKIDSSTEGGLVKQNNTLIAHNNLARSDRNLHGRILAVQDEQLRNQLTIAADIKQLPSDGDELQRILSVEPNSDTSKAVAKLLSDQSPKNNRMKLVNKILSGDMDATEISNLNRALENDVLTNSQIDTILSSENAASRKVALELAGSGKLTDADVLVRLSEKPDADAIAKVLKDGVIESDDVNAILNLNSATHTQDVMALLRANNAADGGLVKAGEIKALLNDPKAAFYRSLDVDAKYHANPDVAEKFIRARNSIEGIAQHLDAAGQQKLDYFLWKQFRAMGVGSKAEMNNIGLRYFSKFDDVGDMSSMNSQLDWLEQAIKNAPEDPYLHKLATDFPDSSLKVAAHMAGVRDQIPDGEFVVLIHGTDESFANQTVSQNGQNIGNEHVSSRVKDGANKGEFSTTDSLEAARKYAKLAKDEGRGNPALVAVAIPEDVYNDMVARGLIKKKGRLILDNNEISLSSQFDKWGQNPPLEKSIGNEEAITPEAYKELQERGFFFRMDTSGELNPRTNVSDSVTGAPDVTSTARKNPTSTDPGTRTRPGRRDNNSPRIEDLRNRYASGDPNESLNPYNTVRVEASNRAIRESVPEAHQQNMLELVARGPNGKRVADEILQLGPEESARLGIYDLLATKPHLDELEELVSSAKQHVDVQVTPRDHTGTHRHIDKRLKQIRERDKVSAPTLKSAEDSIEVLRKTLGDMDVDPDTAMNIADLIQRASNEGKVVKPESIRKLAQLTREESELLVFDLTSKQQMTLVQMMNNNSDDSDSLLKMFSKPDDLVRALDSAAEAFDLAAEAQAREVASIIEEMNGLKPRMTREGKILEDATTGGAKTEQAAWDVMREMLNENSDALGGNKILSDKYEIIPVSNDTMTDGFGGDFLLINKETGDYMLVDVKQTQRGDHGPLRNGGIITVPQSASPLQAEGIVRNRIGQMVARMEADGAPLNLRAAKPPTQRVRDRNIAEALEQAREPEDIAKLARIWRDSIANRQRRIEDFVEDVRQSAVSNGNQEQSKQLRDFALHFSRRRGHLTYLEKLDESVQRLERALETTPTSREAVDRARRQLLKDYENNPDKTPESTAAPRPNNRRPGRQPRNFREHYASGDPSDTLGPDNALRLSAYNRQIKESVPSAHQKHMNDLVARGLRGQALADDILRLGPEESARLGIYDLLATRPHIDDLEFALLRTGTRSSDDVSPALLKKWFKHEMDGLTPPLDSDELEIMNKLIEEGHLKYRMVDNEFLRTHNMRAREYERRVSSYNAIGSAENYNPAHPGNRPVFVIFDPRVNEYHVMNGNNRVYLFGDRATNPNNLGLPVWMFDSPKAFEDLFDFDHVTNGRSYPFNWDD